MSQVRRRLGQFTWAGGQGPTLELADERGEAVAEVTADEGTGLWSWYVFLPDAFQINGNPCGLVRSRPAAMAVCETILVNTILRH